MNNRVDSRALFGSWLLFSVGASLCGCDSAAPPVTPHDGGGSDAGTQDAGPAYDGGGCEPRPDDYTPRVSASSTDTWPACITDTATTYPRISTDIGSVARVAAFDNMFAPMFGGVPGVLYGPERDPTTAEFLQAREIYQTPEGIESRINRRPDTHYAEPARPASCVDEYVCRCYDVAAANADYCTGPALLKPVVMASLNQGITGDPSEASRIYAARVDAALEWTFYLSSFKESLTCDSDTADCDSAWGYYTGGEERGGGLGLARLVRALEPGTHDRIWDGLLAVRCWRDLDTAIPPANVPLQMRARGQQDAALIRGMIAIIEDRLRSLSTTTGVVREAHLAWLRVLLAPIPEHTINDGLGMDFTVPAHASLVDRTIRVVDAASADFIATEIVKGPDAIDVGAIVTRLNDAYPCP